MDADDALAPTDWLKRLDEAHRSEYPSLERLDDHYSMLQPLTYMAPELVAELGDRMTQVIVAWPQLVVDSVEERLQVEGFRLGGEDEADDALWTLWQANDLDDASSQAHVDALVCRRAYGIVGTNEDDPNTPLMTFESALDVVVERDARTRRLEAAAKYWTSTEDAHVRRATLYLPDETSYWLWDGKWVPDPDGVTDEHGKGVVPVVEFVNRPRLSRRQRRPWRGVSDLDPVLPLSDAASKMATDMMVSGEFHAMPRRYVLGARDEDFEDEAGRPVSAFSRIAGRIWAMARGRNEGVEVGTFPEANLQNFHDTLRLLAQLTATIAGLPPTTLGLTTDNPASADAIRAAEARLIRRCERKQVSFGASHEAFMRLALLWRDGSVPAEASRMETLWRDPATPTVAQKADAAVKLYQAQIIPREQAWEDMGYSATAQRRMQAALDEAAEKAAAQFGVVAAMPGDVPAQRQPAEAESETESGSSSED